MKFFQILSRELGTEGLIKDWWLLANCKQRLRKQVTKRGERGQGQSGRNRVRSHRNCLMV